MFCRYCGAEVPDDDVFCQSCGRKLVRDVASRQAAEDRLPETKPKPKSDSVEGATGEMTEPKVGQLPDSQSKGVGVMSTVAVNVGSGKDRHHSVVAIAVVVAAVIAVVLIGAFVLDVVSLPWDIQSDDSPSAKLISLEGTGTKVTNEDEAREVVLSLSDQFGIADLEQSLGECTADSYDDSTYYSFAQVYDDVPVYGGRIVVEAVKDGTCTTISSGLYDIASVSTTPTISVEDAVSSAKKMRSGSLLQGDCSLAILSDGKELCSLVYVVEVENGPEVEKLFVSAEDGSLIQSQSLAMSENVGTLYQAKYGITAYDAKNKEVNKLTPTRGTDEHGNAYSFHFSDDGSSYFYIAADGTQLEDDSGDYYVTLKNGNNVIAKQAGVSVRKVQSGDKVLKPAKINLRKMSRLDDKTMSVINRTVSTLDFYSEILHRDSFNGKGGAINLVANADISNFYNQSISNTNAFSTCTSPYLTNLVFGRDEDIVLDLIGHEFTHSVTSSVCQLQGQGEAGAIAEGVADVFGELVEDYGDGSMNGSCDWDHNGIRNIADPSVSTLDENDDENGAHPSVYKGDYWGDTEAERDNGFTHQNSTVISHAAYQMCAGALDGEALTTTEMGRLLLGSFYMLPQDCDFQMFVACVESRASRTLATSKADRVKAAFDAAGIEPGLIVYLGDSDSSESDSDDAPSPLEAYARQLNITNRSAEYLYSAYRDDAGDLLFLFCTPGDGIDEDAAIGSLVRDFDGDGSDELLVAVWRDRAIDLDMYEEKSGSVKLAASMNEDLGGLSASSYPGSSSFPLNGYGSFDVGCSEEGGIYLQWWWYNSFFTFPGEWNVRGISYTGKKFKNRGSTAFFNNAEGTRSDLRDMGLDADYVPDEDTASSAEPGHFATSALCDIDDSLTLVTRVVAHVDDFDATAEEAKDELGDRTDEWGSLHHLGALDIGPDVSSLCGQKIPSLTADSESLKPSSESAWKVAAGEYSFSSGSGGWATNLVLSVDGTFTGTYSDTDLGATGAKYPNGTRYETNFIGAFADPVKKGAYSYTMKLASLEITDKPGESIEDGVKVVHNNDEVYGLGTPTTSSSGSFTLYLPGQKKSQLSDNAKMWLYQGGADRAPSTLDFCAIVNSGAEDYGFRGTEVTSE